MRAIKGLVIFMGLLLVAGLALLGWGLSTKTGGAKPMAAAAGFAPVTVPLPAGSRIEQVLSVGDRVVLRLSGGGPERLLVLDPATGRVSGSFVMTVEPPVQ